MKFSRNALVHVLLIVGTLGVAQAAKAGYTVTVKRFYVDQVDDGLLDKEEEIYGDLWFQPDGQTKQYFWRKTRDKHVPMKVTDRFEVEKQHAITGVIGKSFSVYDFDDDSSIILGGHLWEWDRFGGDDDLGEEKEEVISYLGIGSQRNVHWHFGLKTKGTRVNVRLEITKTAKPTLSPTQSPTFSPTTRPYYPSSFGDPHFKTWGGETFDFHGGCDVVLLTCPDFDNGIGLEVHIRTKITRWWSYIATVVVAIGDHTYEVTGGKTKIGYFLDGVYVNNLETGSTALGDYAMQLRRVNEHQSQTHIKLGNGNALSIENWGEFMRVDVKALVAEKFKGSLGMMGSFPGGLKIARDNHTLIEDTNSFGQEWQVRSTDGMLFQAVDGVQYPEKCAMPDDDATKTKRRLGEGGLTLKDAEAACAHVSDEFEHEACVADVLATNDKDMASAY